jgi:hypothetical protein
MQCQSVVTPVYCTQDTHAVYRSIGASWSIQMKSKIIYTYSIYLYSEYTHTTNLYYHNIICFLHNSNLKIIYWISASSVKCWSILYSTLVCRTYDTYHFKFAFILSHIFSLKLIIQVRILDVPVLCWLYSLHANSLYWLKSLEMQVKDLHCNDSFVSARMERLNTMTADGMIFFLSSRFLH